ncbi:hypothetical protein F7725_023536 [Dissostichus mawsoni]|uniref:Uncharacterized protein n=1 Tax=Dissostichus mawsoni TaxID=36200 RepID=A0A7J5Z2Y7_DISMA|nr:hypothetical protein F7725_023536 [Dissostichus mawsoni]
MVGLASRRILLHPTTDHMVAQMVFNVVYPMAPDQRRHVSINSARWLPDPGMGLAYGTNKGDLVICRPVPHRSGWRLDRDMGLMNAIVSLTLLLFSPDCLRLPREDALARIRRLIAEGGMTAVVQREQSTTMASMGGFGNNIIVSHRNPQRLPDRGQQGAERQSLSGTSATGQSLTGTSATGQSLNANP